MSAPPRRGGVARVAAFAAALPACSRGGPEAVADRFVDAYLVQVSQTRALALASGPARDKLQEELKLVAGVRRSGYTPEQARASTVTWRRGELSVQGDRARVEYAVTVEAGGETSHRRALLSLRGEGGRWTVSNYSLIDGAAPARPEP